MNDDSVTDSVMKAVLFSCVCVCISVCDNWPLYNKTLRWKILLFSPKYNMIIKSLILSNAVFLSFKKCDFVFFFLSIFTHDFQSLELRLKQKIWLASFLAESHFCFFRQQEKVN